MSLSTSLPRCFRRHRALNIQFHLPFVLTALLDAALADKSMVLMALGTIRAETGKLSAHRRV